MYKNLFISIVFISCMSIRVSAQDWKEQIGQSTMDTMGDVYSNIGNQIGRYTGYEAEGYPNFQLQVGASRLYGEFARLKFCGGGEGGFAIYGGVGKDYLFKGEYDDRLLWHAAVGYYGTIGDTSDFTLGVSYAQTSQLYDKVMGLDGTFRFYFGDSTRFGVFIGGGAGVTSPFGYLTGDDPDDVKLT